MLIAAFVLLGLALLVALVSNIWFLVVAFQRSVGWGLAVLLLPLANVVFLFRAWTEAKKPFLLGLVALAIGVAGYCVMPKEQFQQRILALAMQRAEAAEATPSDEGSNAATPLSGYASMLLQAKLLSLKAREAALLERKAALDPNDAAGLRALTEEIARYNAELQPALEQKKRLPVVASAQ